MTAVADVLSREFPAATSRQPNANIDVLLSANKIERLGTNVKEHLILGTDKRDAEQQRDLWLSENPAIRVIKIHRVKREPQTLLTLIGSKHVPRVSILVEYEETEVATANVAAEQKPFTDGGSIGRRR
jgi:hypothetical protein